MGFLHSGLLWFAAAGSIPILIHLFNRQRYKRVQWAAMEWLLAAMKKTRRRMQLENLILLLIRVLVLVFLAGALARPFMQSAFATPFAESNTHAVIVLDVSYSMDYRGPDRTTPMEKGRQVANGILNALKTTENDRFSLILLTDSPESLIGEPSSNVENGRRQVGERGVTDYGTSVAETMELVRDALKKSTNMVKKVFIITDNQRHAWTVSEKDRTRVSELYREVSDLTAPNGGGILVYDVGGNVVDNLGVVSLDLADGQKVIATDQPSEFTATIRNHGPIQVSGVSMNILIDGAKQGSYSLTIDPNALLKQKFVHTFRDPGPHSITVELEADALSHDNRRSFAVNVRDALRVLIVNGERGTSTSTDEVAFLKTALNPSIDQRERLSHFLITEVLENGFMREDPRKFDLVILANLETIAPEEVTSLEEYVRSGGGLLMFLGDKTEAYTWNQAMFRNGEGLLPCELEKPAGYPDNRDVFGITGVDYDHPALSFFRDLKASLTRLPISQYYAVKPWDPRPDVRVMAGLNVPGGAPPPLLVERRFGRGRAVLCTTAPDLEWGLMPKFPGYVMLMDQICSYLAAPVQRFRNIEVGEPMEYTLRATEFAKKFEVVGPRQTSSEVSPVQVNDQAWHLSFGGTSEAGVYALMRVRDDEPAPALVSYYAVNVNADEGFVEKLSEQELRSIFPQLKFTYVDQGLGTEPKAITVKAPASNIWKYLLGAVLALLLAETVLAQLFGARR
ncbi:MAG: BatA domain-containing protein [Candidatus Brocadiae bacterium]|nr:BatA domain-containing protein [Candidatus Brocadiia bacterium]